MARGSGGAAVAMEPRDLHAEAWAGIRNGVDSGRLAHAYVIVGSPSGNALHFAESFLKLLYCEADEKPCNTCNNCRLVASHKHVDTLWIEPQSKARQIKAEEIRDLVKRMAQTSFGGGWKAGVLLSAECMNASSANALLKTLEEPPPKSLLLLVTDSPQSLLPTIVSRCQKIVLSDSASRGAGSQWHAPLMEILRDLPPTGGLDATRLAGRLKSILDGVKAGISSDIAGNFGVAEEGLDESRLKEILDARTNAKLKAVQSDVFRIMQDWHRDILMLVSNVDAELLVHGMDAEILRRQAKRHTQASALQALREIDGMSARLERNIPAMQIFDEAFRNMIRN